MSESLIAQENACERLMSEGWIAQGNSRERLILRLRTQGLESWIFLFMFDRKFPDVIQVVVSGGRVYDLR